jgi:hypothetical protein
MTKILIRTGIILLIAVVSGTLTGCIPTNPIGTPTDMNVYHKAPNWIVSDSSSNSGPRHSKSYDLNDDGVDDFTISNLYPGSYGYYIADIYVQNGTLVKGRLEQLSPDSTVLSYTIPQLTNGSLISLQDTFYNTNAMRFASLFVRNVAIMGARTDTHYAGFKVTFSGQPHYAWVKFTETYTFNPSDTTTQFIGTVRINESGFYKVANTPIKTGVW